MLNKLAEHARRLGARMHAFVVGTTIALGAVLLSQMSQSCAISGR